MIDIRYSSGSLRFSVSISEKAVYKRELMKEEYILLSFSTQNVIAFQKCDYIETEFGRFELLELPVPTWNNTTGGYDYEARFDHPYARLKNHILFYTRQGSKEKAWSLTENINKFKAIINDNFKRIGLQYEGSDYELLIGIGVKEDIVKFISFDGTSIWDAIDKIAKEWETEWTVSGNEITIVKCESSSSVVFDRSNMSEITKESNGDKVKPTRIYPFGSDRNIPRYYGKDLIFEITDIYGQGMFEDRNRKLKGGYLSESTKYYDDHLVRKNDLTSGENYLSLQYPSLPTPLYDSKPYMIDFSGYKLLLKTNLTKESKFSYRIYEYEDYNDPLSESTFKVSSGDQIMRVPFSNIDLRYNGNDIRLVIIIRDENGLKEWGFSGEEGSINIRFKNPRGITKAEFISGEHAGGIYDCIYNLEALPDNSDDPASHSIQIQDSRINISIGDKYKIHKLLYNQVPESYFTSRVEDQGVVKNGIVEKRLRLPRGIDHIDAKENMRVEDIIEEVVVFEEIYPRQTGTMAEVSCFEIDEQEDNKPTGQKVNIWRYKDPGLKFSGGYVIAEDLKIHFQTGSLAGLDFGVIYEPRNKDGSIAKETFEIVRNDDYQTFLPNDTLYPKPNDEYILYGYDTQLVFDGLVPAAEEELLKKAKEYISDPEKRTFTCKTNPVICSDKKIDCDVGQKVVLNDPRFGSGSMYSRVYAFEKRLDHKYSCTYTVSETAVRSRLGFLENFVTDASIKPKDGKDGITWKPMVDPEGKLSWSKDSSLVVPPTTSIKGPDGKTPLVSIGSDYKLMVDGVSIGEPLKGQIGKTWKPVLNGDKLAWTDVQTEINPGEMKVVPTLSMGSDYKLLVDGVSIGQSLKGESTYSLTLSGISPTEFIREGQPFSFPVTASLYYGQTEITDTIHSSGWVWKRKSENTLGDPTWNLTHRNTGNTITITEEDIVGDTRFTLDVYADNGELLTTKKV